MNNIHHPTNHNYNTESSSQTNPTLKKSISLTSLTSLTNSSSSSLSFPKLLLQRKAELAQNKAKYSLTESDAQLLTSNSVDLFFEDGQVITAENQDVSHVYRIKSGKVHVTRYGHQFNIIGKGWFIGEPMLIYDNPTYQVKGTMTAMGPVVLQQLDVTFIRKLFKADVILHAKYMRFLATFLSFVLEQVSELDHPAIRGIPASDLSSSTESESITPLSPVLFTASVSNPSYNDIRSSSSSDLTTSGSITPPTPPGDSSLNPKIPHSEGVQRVRLAKTKPTEAYKIYPLVNRGSGIQTVTLATKNIKAISKTFGFSHKTSVAYSNIENITKVGEAAITIIYRPHKVVNLLFKKYFDREEFYEIATSLVANHKRNSSSESVHGQPVSVPRDTSDSYEEVHLSGGTEHLYKTMQQKQVFRKGDKVFEEGDLIQRTYTLTMGHCNIIQRGKKVGTMEVGEIFGVNTMLNLRPIPVTLEVASDDAEFLVIHAQAFNEMINHEPQLALVLYRDAAQVLDEQLTKILGLLPNTKRILREQQEASEEKTKDQEVIVIA